MIDIQLKNAGLTDYFDSTYSVEAVHLAKPFPDIYQFAAKKEKRSPKQIAMVASHDWDIVGAKKRRFSNGIYLQKTITFKYYILACAPYRLGTIGTR